MNILLYRNRNTKIGMFMEAIGTRLRAEGHTCNKITQSDLALGKRLNVDDVDALIIWNGEKPSMQDVVKRVRDRGGVVLHAEHGYLRRRTSWQLDPAGINANSTNAWWESMHTWASGDEWIVEQIRSAVKEESDVEYDAPRDYALIALQTPTDVNITNHCPRYMNMNRVVQDVKEAIEMSGVNLRVVVRHHPKVASKQGIKQPSLAEQLNPCRFLITVNSNTAIEALAAKKDVIAIGPHIYTSSKWPGRGGVTFYCNRKLKTMVKAIIECENRILLGVAEEDTIRDAFLRYVWDREWTMKDIESGDHLPNAIRGRPKRLCFGVTMKDKWHQLWQEQSGRLAH